jgi:hypothetical protein
MDHADGRALNGTNEKSGLGPRCRRLPTLYTSLFLACRAVAPPRKPLTSKNLLT